ncbi:MAG TPA: DUF1573 domain-containing protein [Chitinophagaceae bacterium]|nr:DUF1573 domain-containing protein [Chitinophagaceae bacterium]
MKKLLLVLTGAICFVACQQRTAKTAGEKPVDPTQDSTNFTTIQWIDSVDKDLGTVKEGPEVEVGYKFKNTGDHPLIISDVRASCGCTIPEKPQEPFEPGATGTIRAKFTTKGHVGANVKSITVTANTKKNVYQELTFRINVEADKPNNN